MPLPIGSPKPSELMLKAKAEGFTQITGRLSDGDQGACALGHVYIGAGFEPEDITDSDFDSDLVAEKYFDKLTAVNPVTGYSADVPSVIIDLNDERDWSILQIANWLRTKLAL